ncbi:hypothetical protein SNK03_010965 [Fusarium graminearum]
MTYYCPDCDRHFHSGRKARDQHCLATGHALPQFDCDTCSFCFDDEYDRCEHMNLEMHWAHNVLECRMCYLRAVSKDEISKHEIELHNYCADCERQFSNLNCIRQHLNGKIHRVSTVNCPFCKAKCGTATGLSCHLERGSCPRVPMNRKKLYKYVRNRDPAGVIVNKRLEWHGERTYEINPRLAWNHWAKTYECYLCHKLHSSLHGLKLHLESPKHQQKLYHCLNPTCRKEFATLAALINHLESESCKILRFQQAQRGISSIVDPNRMISN